MFVCLAAAVTNTIFLSARETYKFPHAWNWYQTYTTPRGFTKRGLLQIWKINRKKEICKKMRLFLIYNVWDARYWPHAEKWLLLVMSQSISNLYITIIKLMDYYQEKTMRHLLFIFYSFFIGFILNRFPTLWLRLTPFILIE